MNIPLEYGFYYHIYNRGNNYENIFINENDYLHFLKNYEIYISPIADTFAWCLMKNHFHLLVRIKEEDEIGFLNAKYAKSEDADLKWKMYVRDRANDQFYKKPIPASQFKHLFNSYARWFNLKHKRRGSLFEKNFERKQVDNQKYFANLIGYINNNPVLHEFVEHSVEYPWSSYLDVLSDKPTYIKKKQVLHYFDDVEDFKFQHDLMDKKHEEHIKHLIIE